MNKQPSKTVDEFILFIDTNPLDHEDIKAHLRIMADNFRRGEAQAVKALYALNQYHGVEAL